MRFIQRPSRLLPLSQLGGCAVALLVALTGCSAGDDGDEDSAPSVNSTGAPLMTATDAEQEFVPNQIVVKFKSSSPVGAVAHALLDRGQRFETLTGNGSLDALHRRFNAKRIRKLFRDEQEHIPAGIITETISADVKHAARGRAKSRTQRLLQRRGLPARPTAPDLGSVFAITFDGDVDVAQAVVEYQADPDVERASPNAIYRTMAFPDDSPNDPLYASQWAHGKTSALDGWAVQLGSPNVVVAVVDSGVDYLHEDLAPNIWRDANGNPGKDFVDIDVALYTSGGNRTIPGEDYTGVDDDPMDFGGHGTHCAGIVGAVADNGVGVAGVAPGVTIMPVRAGFSLEQDGEDPETGEPIIVEVGVLDAVTIANSIVYAADNGADVISMSFGGIGTWPIVDAIEHADTSGAVLVAAAGNRGFEQKNVSSPGSMVQTLAVAASGPDDERAVYSNFGEWIDVTAPGGQATIEEAAYGTKIECISGIVSTVPTQGGAASDPGGYRPMCGTSMAAPYVAGLAALVKSQFPAANAEEIRGRIIGTADALQCEDAQKLGSGRVNVERALTEAPRAYLDLTDERLSPTGCYGDTVANGGEEAALTFTLKNEWANANVTVFAKSLDSRAFVKNPQWNVGAVSAFATVDNADHPFLVDLGADIQRDEVIDFEITLVSGMDVRMLTITLPVGIRPLASRTGEYSYPAVSGRTAAFMAFPYDLGAFTVAARDIDSGAEIRSGDYPVDTGAPFEILDLLRAPMNPRISGDVVVFEDNREGFAKYDVYMLDLQTGVTSPIATSDSWELQPDVSGSHIVWTQQEGDFDIMMRDLETGQDIVVCDAAGDQAYPKVSSSHVVWLDQRDADAGYRIFTYDLATGQESAVQTPAAIYSGALDISGGKLAYLMPVTPDSEEIHVYTHDLATDVTSDQGQIDAAAVPQISGNRLLLSRWVDDWSQLFLLDLGSQEEIQLTRGAENHRQAAFSDNVVVWTDGMHADPGIFMTEVGPAFGDVNWDRAVDGTDANLVAQYYSGLDPQPFHAEVADVNCSGSVDILDALLIGQFSSGAIARLPCQPE